MQRDKGVWKKIHFIKASCFHYFSDLAYFLIIPHNQLCLDWKVCVSVTFYRQNRYIENCRPRVVWLIFLRTFSIEVEVITWPHNMQVSGWSYSTYGCRTEWKLESGRRTAEKRCQSRLGSSWFYHGPPSCHTFRTSKVEYS